MSKQKLERGDIVLFNDGKVTYTGMVFRVGSHNSNEEPMYGCKFFNKATRKFGRTIWKFQDSLMFIGSMPEGAEWDVQFAA